MAIVNLQLSALNMETLPVAYYKIIEAINERKTILNAFNIDTSYAQDWGHYTDSYGIVDRHQPNYAMCMNSLMHCVYRMGQYFTDLSAEYIQDSYANFPKSFSMTLRSDTEHKIGTSIRQYNSFDDDTIDSWKSVLSTAAYWLNRYTAINVPKEYRSVMQTCEYGTKDLSSSTAFTTTETEERRSNMSFNITHSSYEYYRPTESGTDAGYSGTRRYSGNFGLTLDNRTPYSANVLLYLCLPSVADTAWNNVNKWQSYSYSMEIYSGLWVPYEDEPTLKYPGEGNGSNGSFVLAGGQWRQRDDTRTWIKYSAGSQSGTDNHQLSSTEHFIRKNYTHDGREQCVLDETSASEGEDTHIYYYSWAENELNVNRKAWDGLGIWTSPSEPFLAEVIPARTKKKITATFFNNLPEPSKNRLTEIIPAGWRHGSCWWDENLANSYDLRVVPILDYSDSVTTFSFDEE